MLGIPKLKALMIAAFPEVAYLLKLVSIYLAFASCVVSADTLAKNSYPSEDYDAKAWMAVSFDDRAVRFNDQVRDADWAPGMERAITNKVAELDRPLTEVFGEKLCSRIPMCQEEMPSVILTYVECRSTICEVELHWPPGTQRSIIGQQLSLLYELGIDHQGEIRGGDDGTRNSRRLYARRRN